MSQPQSTPGAAVAGPLTWTPTSAANAIPLHISQSVAVVLAAQFTADQLRHLAALKEADAPGMRARRDLDEASVEELAQMLTAGKHPTIGWWRRHAGLASLELAGSQP